MISVFVRRYFGYIKLAAWLAVVVAAMAASWKVRSAVAHREQQQAVQSVIEQAQKDISHERKLRADADRVAGERVDQLLHSIAKVEAAAKQVSRAISAERAANKPFYEQPLPAGGYEQWKKARALVSAQPASAP